MRTSNILSAPLRIKSPIPAPAPSFDTPGLVLNPDALPLKRWMWASALSGWPPFPANGLHNPLARRFHDSLDLTFEQWVAREAERLALRGDRIYQATLTAMKPGAHPQKTGALYMLPALKSAPQKNLNAALDLLNKREHIVDAGLTIRGHILP